MTLRLRRGGRDLAPALTSALDGWTRTAPTSTGLHSGDVGWHLRLPAEKVEGAYLLWEDAGGPRAVGLVDDVVLRLGFAPALTADRDLATEVMTVARDFEYVDAFGATALRAGLVEDGWSADLDPWVLLYRELTDEDVVRVDEATRPPADEAEVEARTAVQRSAFAPGSTFHRDYWRRMATGPTFDPRFEMVTWTREGRPAAAATGWFAGVGACALLEPVGTHQDHRRQGYGRRVNLAVMAALARAGASAVRVLTPASNAAAVGTYLACGLRQVDLMTAVTRPR